MPYHSDIIVIGCGNILFKDDGFGPVLINILPKYFNDTNDYYDPAVTSYVEDEFNKEKKEIENEQPGKSFTYQGGFQGPPKFRQQWQEGGPHFGFGRHRS